MQTKICVRCNVEKEIDKFGSIKPNSKNEVYFRHVCKSCLGKRTRARSKYFVLKEYGFKCVCCNEDDFRFLTIDHINNDGFLHKKEHLGHLYAAVRREGYPKDKYQILCYNCNCARVINKGVCPHKLKDKEQALKDFMTLCFDVGRRWVNRSKNITGLSLGTEVAAMKRKKQAIIRQASEFGFTEDQLKEFGVIK